MNLVFKTITRPPAASSHRVATLNDKTRDDSVEGQSVVKFARDQIQEVRSSYGSLGRKDRCFDIPFCGVYYYSNIIQHLMHPPLQRLLSQGKIGWKRIHNPRFAFPVDPL